MNMFWEVFENCRTCSKSIKVAASADDPDNADGYAPSIDLFSQCRQELKERGWLYLPLGPICPDCVDVTKITKIPQI